MLCWVLGLLVLPTVRVPLLMYWVSLPGTGTGCLSRFEPVSLLAPGVSAGEGVVALCLGGCGEGVGGGAGVGVAVTGPGCVFGRGWSLGVAGCGRSPLLAEGLVGLPLCPSGVSGSPAAPLA